ncbi:MAG: hypothetical protein ACJ8AK_10820 [Gemmatimonadaceae bacterium]
MFRVPVFVLAVAVLAAGCTDTQSTAPRPPVGDPSKMILDAAHHGGNPDFFFLPLIGPDARNSPYFDKGKFNATLTPIVKICKLVLPVTGATTRLVADVPRSLCGPLVATLSDVTVSPALEFYLASWKTRNYNLDPDAFYRVQVFVGSTMLGFVDVTVVTSLKEAVNALTGEVVPFADDFTLPIPFRIEAGALTGGASSACKGTTPDCVEVSVKKAGGTFFTNTKWAGIQLESGWVSDEALALGGGSIVLTIERVRAKDGDCHGGSDGEPGEAAALGSLYVELNGCYHYATDPSLVDPRIPEAKRGFQTDNNKVGQCTHELPTDAGMADADYMLFKSDPGQRIIPLKDVPAPVGLSCTDFAFYQALPDNPVLRYASIKLHNLRNALSRFVVNEAYAWDGGLGGTLPRSPTSALSNISRGVGLRAARTSTNNQTGLAGTSIEFRVRVTTEHLHAGQESRAAKAGVPVTFTVPDELSGDFGEGGTSYTATTDENGEAAVPWYLAVGTHTISATVPTIDPTPITFTALGTAAVDLGVLAGDDFSQAFAVNSSGQVVGFSGQSGGQTRAFRWTSRLGMIALNLPTDEGGNSSATGINDNGVVVGEMTVGGARHAFRWENGVTTDLGVPSWASSSKAAAINTSGTIVGWNDVVTGEEAHGWSWNIGGPITNLGVSSPITNATAINDAGQIVGSSGSGHDRNPWIRQSNGSVTFLGGLTAGRSAAFAINSAGVVVGASDVASEQIHPFRWTAGVMLDLGTLGGRTGSAGGIDDAGRIVGSADIATGENHAFVWQNGHMSDLGAPFGAPRSSANAIRGGNIVGSAATAGGFTHAVLWDIGSP